MYKGKVSYLYSLQLVLSLLKSPALVGVSLVGEFPKVSLHADMTKLKIEIRFSLSELTVFLMRSYLFDPPSDTWLWLWLILVLQRNGKRNAEPSTPRCHDNKTQSTNTYIFV